jgi:hypothetical protein
MYGPPKEGNAGLWGSIGAPLKKMLTKTILTIYDTTTLSYHTTNRKYDEFNDHLSSLT